jgi:hypothetical protein
MPALDIFASNPAFGMQSLTVRLLDQPHVPRRLGELGIFDQQGISTVVGWVERQGNTLRLVQTTPRNTPAIEHVKDTRSLVAIPTVRIAKKMQLYADEVQGLRRFGSENELQGLMEEVAYRAMQVSQDIDATVELHRIGAIKGQVLDVDGSVITDLFTTFGVSQQSEVDFDLDNGTPASGALRKKCALVERLIRDELGGLPYSTIYALCSSQFFDDLIAHTEVRETVKNFPAALSLRERGVGTGTNGQPVMTLQFGGITWEEYRGSVGGTQYVADNKAHLFPLGVPELFQTRYAPAEWWETVNTIGLPRYMMLDPETMNHASMRGWIIQTQLFNICTRPRTLIPARRT